MSHEDDAVAAINPENDVDWFEPREDQLENQLVIQPANQPAAQPADQPADQLNLNEEN